MTKKQWNEVLVRLRNARKVYGSEIKYRTTGRVKYFDIMAVPEGSDCIILDAPLGDTTSPLVTVDRFHFGDMHSAIDAFVVVKPVCVLNEPRFASKDNHEN